MPLFELVTEISPKSKKSTFEESYLYELSNFTFPFMIDIPLYLNTNKSTKDSVRDFIDKFKNTPSLKVDYYKKLAINKNIIPVLSYSERDKFITNTFIIDISNLRSSFNRIAFRVFNTKNIEFILKDIQSIITKDDILILDIGKYSYTDKKISEILRLINSIKQKIQFTSVIIRSAINKDIIFNRMSHGNIVPEANNDLLIIYPYLGFDAFGDFAGIRKNPTISDGGGGNASAGFLFYSWSTNNYIGFRGSIPKYSEFITTIKPSLLNSSYWNAYSDKHHSNCPGCINISSTNSKSPTHWKSYTIEHYITTLEEYL